MSHSFFVPSTSRMCISFHLTASSIGEGFFFGYQLHQAGTAFFQVFCSGQSFVFHQLNWVQLLQPTTASSTTFFRLCTSYIGQSSYSPPAILEIAFSRVFCTEQGGFPPPLQLHWAELLIITSCFNTIISQILCTRPDAMGPDSQKFWYNEKQKII